MFHLLEFLFFSILIILVIGLALISKIIRTILGIGRHMTTGNVFSSANTSSRNNYSASSKRNSTENNSYRQSNQTTSRKKKIFGNDEGEYIDFEEVKE